MSGTGFEQGADPGVRSPLEPAVRGEHLLVTAADTERLGERIGAGLSAGDVVILSGPLGAGKTVLAKGIGRGLGVSGVITSPTFVIAREHPPGPDGRGVGLVHVDAYRLGGSAELDDLDLDTDLSAAVVVVEWGEGMAEGLAGSHLLVRLRRRGSEDGEDGADGADGEDGAEGADGAGGENGEDDSRIATVLRVEPHPTP